jgi:catechol 2,3-dioxygenase-like lactoylglutathione lyase family enzyme
MRETIEAMLTDYERGRLSRRQLATHLAGLAAAAVGLTGPSAGAQEEPGPAPTFRSTGVDHVALRVTDVGRSRDFYVRHLGLRPTGACSGSSCFLDCGDDFLALFRGTQPGLDHYAFAVDGYDPVQAVERLRAAGLEPDRRANRVYFPDPDGIEVQVTGG